VELNNPQGQLVLEQLLLVLQHQAPQRQVQLAVHKQVLALAQLRLAVQ
jgi:hypothetical protein